VTGNSAQIFEAFYELLWPRAGEFGKWDRHGDNVDPLQSAYAASWASGSHTADHAEVVCP